MSAERNGMVLFVKWVVIVAVALMFVISAFLCARGVWNWRVAFHEFTYRGGIAYMIYLFVKMYYDVEELKDKLKDYESKD